MSVTPFLLLFYDFFQNEVVFCPLILIQIEAKAKVKNEFMIIQKADNAKIVSHCILIIDYTSQSGIREFISSLY